jgi:hypothetical protein
MERKGYGQGGHTKDRTRRHAGVIGDRGAALKGACEPAYPPDAARAGTAACAAHNENLGHAGRTLLHFRNRAFAPVTLS